MAIKAANSVIFFIGFLFSSEIDMLWFYRCVITRHSLFLFSFVQERPTQLRPLIKICDLLCVTCLPTPRTTSELQFSPVTLLLDPTL
jgi:hypothetical protein